MERTHRGPPAATEPRARAQRSEAPSAGGRSTRLRDYLGVLSFTRRGLSLVWRTDARLAVGLAACSALAGLAPGAIAWVGRSLVDAVVSGARAPSAAGAALAQRWVLIELALLLALAAVTRASSVLRALLRQRLGQRINVLILEKALTLSLTQFEDSELYDQMTRPRMEAPVLSLLHF